MSKYANKEDLNTLKETLKEIKDKKKLYNETYRNKQKEEIKSEPIINKIECIPKENIKKEEDSDWSEWWWETGIGTLKMLGQTLIQTITTISVPALIMWMMPRQNIPQQITSSSQVPLRQSEKDTKQQQTVSSLSQLM